MWWPQPGNEEPTHPQKCPRCGWGSLRASEDPEYSWFCMGCGHKIK